MALSIGFVVVCVCDNVKRCSWGYFCCGSSNLECSDIWSCRRLVQFLPIIVLILCIIGRGVNKVDTKWKMFRIQLYTWLGIFLHCYIFATSAAFVCLYPYKYVIYIDNKILNFISVGETPQSSTHWF